MPMTSETPITERAANEEPDPETLILVTPDEITLPRQKRAGEMPRQPITKPTMEAVRPGIDSAPRLATKILSDA